MPTQINTKSARRRMVAFASQEDVARDLDALEAAHAAGRLRRLGNHEAGAIFNHLAKAMEASFDGFNVRTALWLRVLGPIIKGKVLSGPFKPGLKLRPSDERAAWNDSVGFEDGLAQLRGQIARALGATTGPSAPHPFFGRMSCEEWRVYHLRHAELHLSFLQVERGDGGNGRV